MGNLSILEGNVSTSDITIKDIGEIKLISEGMSFCPQCKRIGPSKVFIKNGFYSLVKTCAFDGVQFETILEKADLEFPLDYNLRTKKFPHYQVRLGKVAISEEDIVDIGSLHMVLLFLTQRCNSNCPICYDRVGQKRQDLPLDIIKRALSKYNKGKEVVLYGGEPTVRDDLFEIIKIVKNSGNFPILFTNGFKLADSRYLRELLKAGLSWVYLSFDGFRKEIYEQMRGGAFEYGKKLKALENLERENIQTIIAMTVAKGINEDQIEPIMEYAQRHPFISELTIRPLFIPDMNDESKFGINNLISRKEILEIVSKYINMPIQYFKMFNELKINAYGVMSRFRPVNHPLPGNYDFFFKRERGHFKPLLNQEEIESIIDFLQHRRLKYYLPIFTSRKLRNLSWIILRNLFNIPRIKYDLAHNNKLFRISLGQIRSEWDGDLCHIINSINLGFSEGRELFGVAPPPLF